MFEDLSKEIIKRAQKEMSQTMLSFSRQRILMDMQKELVILKETLESLKGAVPEYNISMLQGT